MLFVSNCITFFQTKLRHLQQSVWDIAIAVFLCRQTRASSKAPKFRSGCSVFCQLGYSKESLKPEGCRDINFDVTSGGCQEHFLELSVLAKLPLWRLSNFIAHITPHRNYSVDTFSKSWHVFIWMGALQIIVCVATVLFFLWCWAESLYKFWRFVESWFILFLISYSV